MSTKIISIDTETTGLYPDQGHVVTEIALVIPNDEFTEMQPYYWLFELTGPEIQAATEKAMKINGYHKKIADDLPCTTVSIAQRGEVAQQIQEITRGHILAGMNCAFDAQFTRKFMIDRDVTPEWNYHLFEIESACVGYLGKAAPFPWKSSTLAKAMGIEPLPANRVHGALEDAIWNCYFLKILRQHTTPHLRVLKGGDK